MYGRHQEDQRRLKHICENGGGWWWGGAYYDETKKRYIRSSKSRTSLYKFYKKVAAKAVRKCADCPQHGGYKKVFDLRWTMY